MYSFKLILFVIFLLNIYLSQCLISDKRLCVNEACSEPVSLAKTLLRYSSPEEHILSFSPNQEIKIFSKEAGSRLDLWGTEIRGKRGYVPKNLVKETKIYTKPTIIVDTELLQTPVKPDKVKEPFELVDGTTLYLDSGPIKPSVTESPVLSTASPQNDKKTMETETSSNSNEEDSKTTEPPSVVQEVLSSIKNWINHENSEEDDLVEDDEEPSEKKYSEEELSTEKIDVTTQEPINIEEPTPFVIQEDVTPNPIEIKLQNETFQPTSQSSSNINNKPPNDENTSLNNSKIEEKIPIEVKSENTILDNSLEVEENDKLVKDDLKIQDNTISDGKIEDELRSSLKHVSTGLEAKDESPDVSKKEENGNLDYYKAPQFVSDTENNVITPNPLKIENHSKTESKNPQFSSNLQKPSSSQEGSSNYSQIDGNLPFDGKKEEIIPQLGSNSDKSTIIENQPENDRKSEGGTLNYPKIEENIPPKHGASNIEGGSTNYQNEDSIHAKIEKDSFVNTKNEDIKDSSSPNHLNDEERSLNYPKIEENIPPNQDSSNFKSKDSIYTNIGKHSFVNTKNEDIKGSSSPNHLKDEERSLNYPKIEENIPPNPDSSNYKSEDSISTNIGKHSFVNTKNDDIKDSSSPNHLKDQTRSLNYPNIEENIPQNQDSSDIKGGSSNEDSIFTNIEKHSFVNTKNEDIKDSSSPNQLKDEERSLNHPKIEENLPQNRDSSDIKGGSSNEDSIYTNIGKHSFVNTKNEDIKDSSSPNQLKDEERSLNHPKIEENLPQNRDSSDIKGGSSNEDSIYTNIGKHSFVNTKNEDIKDSSSPNQLKDEERSLNYPKIEENIPQNRDLSDIKGGSSNEDSIFTNIGKHSFVNTKNEDIKDSSSPNHLKDEEESLNRAPIIEDDYLNNKTEVNATPGNGNTNFDIPNENHSKEDVTFDGPLDTLINTLHDYDVPIEELFKGDLKEDKDELIEEAVLKDDGSLLSGIFSFFSSPKREIEETGDDDHIPVSISNEENIGEPIRTQMNFDLYLYLGTSAAACIIFLFIFLLVDKNNREAPLVEKINKLESELMITLKEKEALQEGASISDTSKDIQLLKEKWEIARQTLETQVISLQKELAAKEFLEDQIESLEKELETSTEVGMELNRIISEMLDPTNGSEKFKENVEQLKRQLLEQKGVISELKSENGDLLGELNASRRKSMELQKKLDEIVDRILKIEKERDQQAKDFQDEMTLFEQKFGEEVLKKEMLSNEIQVLKSQLSEAQRKAELKIREYQNLKDGFNSIQNDREALQSLIDASSVRAELEQLKAENERYAVHLEQERAAKAGFEGKCQGLLEENNNLAQKYRDSDKDKVEAVMKLEVLNNYFKKREEELQSEILKYKSIWDIKEGEATSTTERIKLMSDEIDNYKSQNETLKQEIVSQEIDLKSQISLLEKKVHENWLTSRQMERKLEDARIEAAQLRNRLTLRERTVIDERMPNRLQSPLEHNGELPLSPPPPIESPTSAPMVFGGRDHMTKSPPLPPFLPPPPGAHFMPPPLPGMPFMPPPPTMFPGDHRPPPLGRMSSPPPLNSRYSPDTSAFLPYDRNTPSPLYDSEYGPSPTPPIRGYGHGSYARDERRDYKRPAHISKSNHRNKGSAVSSGSDHSNDSSGKGNRKMV